MPGGAPVYGGRPRRSVRLRSRVALDAAAEPGDAARRVDRRPGARARLRQPRLPPRRDGTDPPALQRQALDRVPARVPRLAPHARCCSPGRFTELFFLDEATAFAAGHRPCALCRREDYIRFTEIWRSSSRARSAPTRSTRSCTRSGRSGTRRSGTTTHRSTSFPTARSCCATARRTSCSARELLAWTPAGYTARRPRPRAARRCVSRRRRSSRCWAPAGIAVRCCTRPLHVAGLASWRRSGRRAMRGPTVRYAGDDRRRAMDAAELGAFLAERTYCVVATATARGRAQRRSREGSRCSAGRSLATVRGGRLRNLRRDPWLSLVVSEGEGDAHRAIVADGQSDPPAAA